jgi:uncharacterized protein (TIGR03435 family)
MRILLLLLSAAGLGVAQPAVTFDVASVKPSPPGTTGGRLQFLSGGRLSAINTPLDYLIQQLFHLRSFQLAGDKEWMNIVSDGYANRFDIEAKGDPKATEAEVREMAKALLADRFQLVFHMEQRDLPVYSLIISKGGLKMMPTKVESGKPGRGGIAFMVDGWIEGQNVSMPSLASALSELVNRPVIDKTGIMLPFDFRLTFAPALSPVLGVEDNFSGCPDTFAAYRIQKGLASANDSCPSIFTAVQEQLGLKLLPERAPFSVFIVDHVARPTPN